ncbi:MAG: shikimate kinase [Candidatus Margulisiibacteriota bacterium]
MILIGFMGTGKTTIGKLLAERLGYQLIDTDELIVQKAGKAISAIFAEDGEPVFRDLEHTVLRGLLGEQKKVIATGGGIVLRQENRELLKQIGRVVLLEADPEAIISRLKDDNSRPLLQGTNEEKIKKLNDILAVRHPLYEKTADQVIDTTGMTVGEVVEKIVSSI